MAGALKNFMNAVSNTAQERLSDPILNLMGGASKLINRGLDYVTGTDTGKTANKKIDKAVSEIKQTGKEYVDPTSTAGAVGEGLVAGLDNASIVTGLGALAKGGVQKLTKMANPSARQQMINMYKSSTKNTMDFIKKNKDVLTKKNINSLMDSVKKQNKLMNNLKGMTDDVYEAMVMEGGNNLSDVKNIAVGQNSDLLKRTVKSPNNLIYADDVSKLNRNIDTLGNMSNKDIYKFVKNKGSILNLDKYNRGRKWTQAINNANKEAIDMGYKNKSEYDKAVDEILNSISL